MNTKLKTLLISVSVLLLISVVTLFTLLFLINKNKAATIVSAQKIQQEEMRAAQAQRISNVLDRVKEPVATLKNYLVPDAEIADVAEAIERLGTRASIDVTISSLAADDSTNLPIGSINKIKARIDGRGEWKNILAFITLLESMPRKVAIYNVSIRRVEASEEARVPIWNLSLQIEILKIK
ncbi:MAG: type 4a pilus biogenesis protein PilO [Candidatus Pacebacteria bacterium]|jgi:Tfp pilus assembly protein PilO|nr:type 4a pilus biogenesis protein PilO [Candidatus Paceibacterota bacterium]